MAESPGQVLRFEIVTGARGMAKILVASKNGRFGGHRGPSGPLLWGFWSSPGVHFGGSGGPLAALGGSSVSGRFPDSFFLGFCSVLAPQLGAKIDPKSVKKSTKKSIKIWMSFWMHFGSQNEPKMEPNWTPDRRKRQLEICLDFRMVLARIFNEFWYQKKVKYWMCCLTNRGSQQNTRGSNSL